MPKKYEQAIKILQEAKEGDITCQVTYMDEKCHGCLVGHILKVTDGLNYKSWHENQNQIDEPSIVNKLMKKNFGNDGEELDHTLSEIHKDYTCDELDFDGMIEEAIKALEGFRDNGEYPYESLGYDDDDDDYYEDDDYEE